MAHDPGSQGTTGGGVVLEESFGLSQTADGGQGGGAKGSDLDPSPPLFLPCPLRLGPSRVGILWASGRVLGCSGSLNF